MNAMEKLADEIQRVTEIKALYLSLEGGVGEPVVFLMDRSLKSAVAANGSNDPIAVIRAIQDLQGWKE